MGSVKVFLQRSLSIYADFFSVFHFAVCVLIAHFGYFMHVCVQQKAV